MPRKTASSTHNPASVMPCFNEAAARCRGKPDPGGRVHRRLQLGFNEAAARCRGKLRGPRSEEAGMY